MIIAFLGVQGSGKTLSMTYYSYKDFINENRKIFTNMVLSYKSEILTKEQIINYTKDEKTLKESLICLDELQIFLDSRRSQTKANMIMSYLILQMRKRRNDLLYTTQDFMQVEKRLRQQTDIVIFCNMVLREDKDGEIHFIKTSKREFTPEEIKKLYVCNNINVKDELGNFQFIGESYIKAEPIFNLYDTTKLIQIE